MEVCVSTVSIIVWDDALGIPIFLTHWINRDYHNNVTPKIIWHQWYNNYALFLRTGRRGRRPLQVWWDSLYGYRTVLSPCVCFFDGRTVFAPTILLPWVSAFFIRFSSYVRGVTFGIMSQVLHTQNITMHAHVLIQVLYSLFQNLSSYSLSRRACTCPQVSKTLSTYPENVAICCIKNATIAEMLPN